MTKKRTGAPPGSNNGGGRKKSERELIRRNFLVYKDTPITSAQVREAIDLYFNREKFAGTSRLSWRTLEPYTPKSEQ